jgi:hypothetical protein
MISFPITAQELENIKKTEKGYLLTDEQMISLAEYIEDLRVENEKLNAKLDQAKKELERAYNPDYMQRFSDGLKGAALATVIISIINATKN